MSLDAASPRNLDGGTPSPRPAGGSPRSIRRRFLHQRGGMVAVAILLILLAFGLLHPLLWPEAATHQVLGDKLRPPSWRHPGGTDELGRDLLARIAQGIHGSLAAAALAAGIGMAFGLPLGLIAGFRRGWFDAVANRVSEAIQTIPPIILGLAVVAVAGRGLVSSMSAVGVVFVPRFLRVCRATATRVRQENFIEASRLAGTSTLRIVRTHVLPNVATHIIVQATLALGFGMLAEAAVSYLGLGVQPPDASLGSLLNSGALYLASAPYLVIIPGAMIFLIVYCLITIGEALRRCIGSEGTNDAR